MDLLVIGGTGLAGRTVSEAARAHGQSVGVLSRTGEIAVDVRDDAALSAALRDTRPSAIINCAAIVSIPACEADPGQAWRVNARPAAVIARHAAETGARFVQVSTDHFWTGDGMVAHTETAPVSLINEYARTKYAAEALALAAGTALVVRTNIVGWPSPHRGSFAEWALNAIRQDAAADLYADQFVSSLDVWTFAECLLDLTGSDQVGVMNLAASQVFSKADLVEGLATAMDRPLTRARRASVQAQATPRADSVGLDVDRAMQVLGRPLPRLDAVVASLVAHLPETL